VTSRCWSCKEPLYGRRVVSGWSCLCSDCAYEAEYGLAKRIEPEPPPLRRPQDETLFDPNAYNKARKR
jgi:hypothetical protein